MPSGPLAGATLLEAVADAIARIPTAPRGIPLAGAVARRIEDQPGEALGAVDALFAFDAAYTARFGEGPRDIWSAFARHATEPRALVRYAELLDDADWPASGLRERRKARRAGARGLTEAIGRGELLAGQVAAAAHTLRRPRTPRGERLLHIATHREPLPEPDCGCAEVTSGRPPSPYLKKFYETWDDCGDDEAWLCLGCHTIWERSQDNFGPNQEWRWTRGTLARHVNAAAWDRGWGGQFPGPDVVRDLPTFADWVKHLGEAVYAASLP